MTNLPSHLFRGDPCPKHPDNHIRYKRNLKCTVCAITQSSASRRLAKEKLRQECLSKYGDLAGGCLDCGVCNHEALVLEPVAMSPLSSCLGIRSMTELRENDYPDRDAYQIKCFTCNRIRWVREFDPESLEVYEEYKREQTSRKGGKSNG